MSSIKHPTLLQHLLFFFFLLVLGLSELATGQQDQFVYSGFADTNLTLDGVATITPDGLLELTNGTFRLRGHAFHPTPFYFGKTPNGTAVQAPRSFAVSYVFAIYCVQAQTCGHGMASVVAASSNFSDTMPTQYLGLINDHNNGDPANRFFAVELDTNWNDEFKDINNNNVGIDINDLVSVNSSSAGYYDDSNEGNFQNLTLASYEMMQVWVEYDGGRRQISVSLAPINMAKPTKPLLSTSYNLSTVLPDMVYVGFSASTGSFDSRQYVLGWSFGINRPAPAIDITKLPKLPKPPRQGPKPRSKILKKCTHFEWIDEYVHMIKSEGYIDSSVAATWELNLGGVPQMENWGSSDRGAGRVVPMARYLESELTDELKKIKKNQREMIDLQKQANIMTMFFYCCVIALFMFYLLFIVIRGGI